METWNFWIDLVPYFVVYLRQETLWIDYHPDTPLIKNKFIPRGFEHWRSGTDSIRMGKITETQRVKNVKSTSARSSNKHVQVFWEKIRKIFSHEIIGVLPSCGDFFSVCFSSVGNVIRDKS